MSISGLRKAVLHRPQTILLPPGHPGIAQGNLRKVLTSLLGGPTTSRLCVAAVFLITALTFHFPAWSLGLVPIQDDLEVFYFPLMAATGEALRHGTLLLWTPSIFGGYPLFADGEAGMLYPLHLLTLPWFSPEVSLVVLLIVHSFLGSLFSYFFIRTLRGTVIGAVIGGLVYAYGAFPSGQVVHLNVFESMVWLPLELALAERACACRGTARLRYAILAGVVFGIQALTLHIHITILSATAVGLFLAYRGVAGAFSREDDSAVGPLRVGRRIVRTGGRLVRHGLGAASILAAIGVIGVGLSAVQLLPLYELATQTSRGHGLTDAQAAVNSVWPGGFLTLLLPHFYDMADGGYWGPWVKWETTAYVGLLPLALAGLAVVSRSGRYLAFFVGIGILSVLIALGSYAPAPAWSALHSLPAFESLRSPGRFTLLLSLALAVLAAFGADRLARPPMHRGRRVTRAMIVLVYGTLVVCLGAVGVVRGNEWFRAADGVAGPLADQYTRLSGVPPGLTPQAVSALAAGALSPLHPGIQKQLALAEAAVVIITLWLVGGALRRSRLHRAAAGMAVGLVMVDLLAMSIGFHPYGRIADLRPRPPEVLLQNSPEQFRVYTPPTAEEKRAQVDPNRLMVVGLQEANGYSSLEPDRHAMYVNAIEYSDTQLLDLWNVRFVIRRVARELFPSYAGVSFHPARPLVSGRGPAATETFVPDGGPARVSEVLVVGRLSRAADVADLSPVAMVRLEGVDGRGRDLSLLAGRDLSDGAMEVPGNPSLFKHGRAEIAFRYQLTDPAGGDYGHVLYLARLAVESPMTVSRVSVQPTGVAGLSVFGLGLVDPVTGEVTQARHKSKYHLVHRDRQIEVFENAQVMPRAFLVGNGIVASPGEDVLGRMRDGTIDLRRSAILECSDQRGCVGDPLPQAQPPPAPDELGTVRMVSYGQTEVTVQASVKKPAVLVLTDPYFPGWVARVDGREIPMLRANLLFRAAIIPPGNHTVTFSYEPAPVAVGAKVSGGVACLIVAYFAYSAAVALGRRRGSGAAAPWRPAGGPLHPEPAYALTAGGDRLAASLLDHSAPPGDATRRDAGSS